MNNISINYDGKLIKIDSTKTNRIGNKRQDAGYIRKYMVNPLSATNTKTKVIQVSRKSGCVNTNGYSFK